jgi:hypothetical protein
MPVEKKKMGAYFPLSMPQPFHFPLPKRLNLFLKPSATPHPSIPPPTPTPPQPFSKASIQPFPKSKCLNLTLKAPHHHHHYEEITRTEEKK